MWITITLTAAVIFFLICESFQLRRRARVWATARIQAWMVRRLVKALDKGMRMAATGTDMAMTPARKVTEWGQATADAIKDKVIDVTGGGLLKNMPSSGYSDGTTPGMLRDKTEGRYTGADSVPPVEPLDKTTTLTMEGFERMVALRSPIYTSSIGPVLRDPRFVAATLALLGRTMPTTHLDDPYDRSPQGTIMPRGVGDVHAFVGNAPPPEHSLNDYAKYREQDQQIAQLASQLQAIGETPWIAVDAEDADSLLNGEYSPVTCLSLQLNGLSAPPAMAGEQSSIGGPTGASAKFINMGTRTVTVDQVADTAALLARLNNDYYGYVKERRAGMIKILNEYAQTGNTAVAARRNVLVRCGSTKVFCVDKEDQARVFEDLKGLYMAAVADYRNKILKELAWVTRPTVTMTVDHKITSDDPKIVTG